MARQNEVIWSIIERDPGILERFWLHVARDTSDDGCWVWHGPVRGRGSPSFAIGYRSVAAASVAWFAATGDAAQFGRMVRMCGNDLCVRPNHLGWLMSRHAERHTVARNDGYVGIAGTTVDYPNATAAMPRTVRLIGQRDPSINGVAHRGAWYRGQ